MVDTELVSKYVNRKKRRKRARIIGTISSIGLTLMIIIAFCLIKVDRFTITTDNTNQLTLSVDEERNELVSTLYAPPLLNADNIQYTDIPESIEEGLGSKNTDYYFAYSFYLLGNNVTDSLNYELDMSLTNCSNKLENAIRVMIIRDGNSTIYAKKDTDGEAKPIYSGNHDDPNHPTDRKQIGLTQPFNDNKHIILEPYTIQQDEYCKYTIVMWIDGWESDNSMKGGVVQMDLKFSVKS